MSFESIKEKIKEFNEFINKYPNIKEFYLGRALLYAKTKQYKKAVLDYEKAYQNYTCGYDIIDICERNDLIKEAEEFYTKAINLNKNNAENYFNRAYFYRRIDELEKALCDCKSGLKLSPNNENLLLLQKILIEKLKFTYNTLAAKN